MYFLYISSIFFILYYYLFKYKVNIKKKDKKTFDYIKQYKFFLENIEFYDNNFNYLDYHIYNIKYDVIKTIDNSVISINDYFIINYKYNNIKYKYLCIAHSTTEIAFPIYDSKQIKNYIYINKINKALFIINNEEPIDILDLILPFIGPNYNFYEDISKLYLKDILMYYNNRKEIMFYNKLKFINESNNFHLELYDNFNNKFIINDELKWNPNLIL